MTFIDKMLRMISESRSGCGENGVLRQGVSMIIVGNFYLVVGKGKGLVTVSIFFCERPDIETYFLVISPCQFFFIVRKTRARVTV
jgi:hypothetical protein